MTKRLLLLASASGAQVQRFYPGQVSDSRIARITRGDAALLIEVREGWIGPWQGKEETLWAYNANWQWPWIEERLASKRRKILLEGRDPLERIPLYRQVYEWLQKELKFPTKLTKADRDGLETASFYIAKLGITAWESAKEVIKVYKEAVPDLDLKKPEERIQFLIATYQRVLEQVNGKLMAAGVEEVSQSLTVAAEAIHGPGVVVIDAAMFPKQSGLEEFLARLPVEGRFIVVGASSLSAAEVWARNSHVLWVATAEEVAPVVLTLPAADRVYVLGSLGLTDLLRMYLRDTLIEVSPLDLRLGLKVILLALGVPAEVLRELNWNSVESALASLEAA